MHEHPKPCLQSTNLAIPTLTLEVKPYDKLSNRPINTHPHIHSITHYKLLTRHKVTSIITWNLAHGSSACDSEEQIDGLHVCVRV